MARVSAGRLARSAAGAPRQAQRAHEAVGPQRRRADDLRQPARRAAAHRLHLEHAVARMQPAEREGGIALGSGGDARDAVAVEADLDRGGEAGQAARRLQPGQGPPDGARQRAAGQQRQHEQPQAEAAQPPGGTRGEAGAGAGLRGHAAGIARFPRGRPCGRPCGPSIRPGAFTGWSSALAARLNSGQSPGQPWKPAEAALNAAIQRCRGRFGPSAWAGVVELADTPDLGSGGASLGGSNPSARTNRRRRIFSGMKVTTMQVTEVANDGLKRAYPVVVPAADIAAERTRRLDELGRDLRLPGFRPGKVPATVVKPRYGQAVMGEVLEETRQRGDPPGHHRPRPAPGAAAEDRAGELRRRRRPGIQDRPRAAARDPDAGLRLDRAGAREGRARATSRSTKSLDHRSPPDRKPEDVTEARAPRPRARSLVCDFEGRLKNEDGSLAEPFQGGTGVRHADRGRRLRLHPRLHRAARGHRARRGEVDRGEPSPRATAPRNWPARRRSSRSRPRR